MVSGFRGAERSAPTRPGRSASPAIHMQKRTMATAAIFFRPAPPGIATESIGVTVRTSSASRSLFAGAYVYDWSAATVASASLTADARSGAVAAIEMIGTTSSVCRSSEYGLADEYGALDGRLRAAKPGWSGR